MLNFSICYFIVLLFFAQMSSCGEQDRHKDSFVNVVQSVTSSLPGKGALLGGVAATVLNAKSQEASWMKLIMIGGMTGGAMNCLPMVSAENRLFLTSSVVLSYALYSASQDTVFSLIVKDKKKKKRKGSWSVMKGMGILLFVASCIAVQQSQSFRTNVIPFLAMPLLCIGQGSFLGARELLRLRAPGEKHVTWQLWTGEEVHTSY